MFTLAAYFESIDNTANVDIAPVQDDVLTISNAHFLPQRDYDLLASFVSAATLARGRFVSPSNRVVTVPFIRPISVALLPPADPNVADYRGNPFRVRALEELALELTSAIAMGSENAYGLFWLSEGREAMPGGDIFTFRFTGTQTAVVNNWTTFTPVFADLLPAGTYAIVGGELTGATAVAFRVIIEGQKLRPGAIATAALGNKPWPGQIKGGLGIWGRFRSTALPQIQILCNAADTAQEGYLDIIKVTDR